MSGDIAIRVRGLVTRFGAQTVHDGLDLDVRRGEILGVVGPSGSGKSVLLRTIIGLNGARKGSIEVFGTEARGLHGARLHALQQRWGVLFQDGALFSSLTVAENIMVPLREHARLPEDVLYDIATLKVALVGLPPDAANKKPSQLSGGMRKRAGLARALALDPELLFLDEPTAGLGSAATARIAALIAELKRSLTIVLIEHDMKFLFGLADHIFVMHWGQVIAQGSPAELRANPWVQRSNLGNAVG